MEPRKQLDTVMPALAGLAKDVRSDQLDNPTPCADWTVRDLLGHLVGGLTSCATAFRIETPVDVTPRPDLLGDDHGAALAAVVGDFSSAIRAPGAMERALELPFGEIPAPVLLRFLAFDLMMHSWDLATATGQRYTPPDEVVAEADTFAREAVTPEIRAGGSFAAEVTPPPGTSPLERLVAFSGRQP